MRFAAFLLLALLLLPSVAFSQQAKTNLTGDPGSGTGGVTVIGVTNTTNYQYQAPIVSKVNGIPTGSMTTAADYEDGGKSYDTGTRKVAKMPPEWFTCKTADDCDLVPVLCGPSFAVSKTHKVEARAAQCAAIQTCGPKAYCLQSIPDTSKAVCDNGECRTVFQPYKPPLPPAPLGTAHKEPSLDDCRDISSSLVPAMTRAEIERRGFSYDGGLAGIYKNERMFFSKQQQSEIQQQKVCMITIDFRPEHLSDDVYDNPDHFSAWVSKRGQHPSPGDIVIRISEPFIDFYHSD